MKFSTTPDTFTRVISGLVIALPAVLLLFVREATIPVLLLSGVLFLTYGFSPRHYILTPDELIIKRLFGKVHLKLTDIKTVVPLPEAGKLRWRSIRTFGSGGLFGYFGKFWNKPYGHMTWYLNNFRNGLLLEMTNGKKVLLSPDDPEMITRLQDLTMNQPTSE